ncbi:MULTISPECIES: endonuclease/exonuclease/phosphatase family protein [unclassified Micromonospora]|uniref:endonuclease/exonuclease/phosphatase family protein n=1 Tax=unclassified Micromonospora TaxID=2617518 RepID=UPI00363497EA
MTHLGIVTYNYEAGGYRDGAFDMEPLRQTFAALDVPPAIILFCEAKHYRRNQHEGLRLAERALTEALHAPYTGLLGVSQHGPIPPAIFYHAGLVTHLVWPGDDPHDPDVFADKRNVGRFRVSTTGAEFGAWVAHFTSRSGAARLEEAKLIDRYGNDPLPFIGGGDLNSTASGGHLPQRDWQAANHHTRTHKGKRIDDGTPKGTGKPTPTPSTTSSADGTRPPTAGATAPATTPSPNWPGSPTPTSSSRPPSSTSPVKAAPTSSTTSWSTTPCAHTSSPAATRSTSPTGLCFRPTTTSSPPPLTCSGTGRPSSRTRSPTSPDLG